MRLCLVAKKVVDLKERETRGVEMSETKELKIGKRRRWTAEGKAEIVRRHLQEGVSCEARDRDEKLRLAFAHLVQILGKPSRNACGETRQAA
jgi:hypothetical protein